VSAIVASHCAKYSFCAARLGKALWWEAGGLILWHKRLERGTFELPTTTSGDAHVTLDAVQLAMLIGGVSLSAARVRRQRLNVA
jgi:transposase